MPDQLSFFEKVMGEQDLPADVRLQRMMQSGEIAAEETAEKTTELFQAQEDWLYFIFTADELETALKSLNPPFKISINNEGHILVDDNHVASLQLSSEKGKENFFRISFLLQADCAMPMLNFSIQNFKVESFLIQAFLMMAEEFALSDINLHVRTKIPVRRVQDAVRTDIELRAYGVKLLDSGILMCEGAACLPLAVDGDFCLTMISHAALCGAKRLLISEEADFFESDRYSANRYSAKMHLPVHLIRIAERFYQILENIGEKSRS